MRTLASQLSALYEGLCASVGSAKYCTFAEHVMVHELPEQSESAHEGTL
jgi:hypothetical protein